MAEAFKSQCYSGLMELSHGCVIKKLTFICLNQYGFLALLKQRRKKTKTFPSAVEKREF